MLLLKNILNQIRKKIKFHKIARTNDSLRRPTSKTFPLQGFPLYYILFTERDTSILNITGRIFTFNKFILYIILRTRLLILRKKRSTYLT